MVFSSLEFLYLFFPLCMLFYYLCKSINAKNAVLIVFSLIFYAWGEPCYVFLMIGTILLDYLFGLGIGKYRTQARGKLLLVLALIVNLGLLGLFKYAGFIANTINSITGLHLTDPKLALPIGISFYTFQVVSYLVDVYRGDVQPQREPHKLMLYICLFHQLIAGPIVRYEQIANEIEHRKATPVETSMGIDRFIVGLSKKVILANAMGKLASVYLDADNLASVPTLAGWFALAMYGLQIYFDFSAYSDMAIGMGRMIGFHYLENFNYPYLSGSITEFWRRWHISLGTLFRDYVYIPMGGNRCSSARHIFNMFVVWALTGLWHGASWNFVLWGLYFFVLLVLEKYVIGGFLKKHKIFAHIYFLVAIVFGWSLFYFTDMTRWTAFVRVLFGGGKGFADSILANQVRSNLFIVLIAIIGATPVLQLIKRGYMRVCGIGRVKKPDGSVEVVNPVPAAVAYIVKGVVLAALLFICTAMLVGQSYNPFIYGRF